MTQLIRQCIAPNQKDWAIKLPAIEFAMNLSRSETTGFSPFLLNTGYIPCPLVVNTQCEYPGVSVFVTRIRDTVFAAHDAILTARVKQTRSANRSRRATPFVQDDLVYLSTQNLSLPKNCSRKLAPKFIGPFRILKDYGNNTFKLDLPPAMLARGIHPAFHASLLRICVPNDDRRFPGRDPVQVLQLTDDLETDQWPVDRIVDHAGHGNTALFQVLWKAGDKTWLPYIEVRHLSAFDAYLDACGVTSVAQLPAKLNQLENAENSTNGLSLASISFWEQTLGAIATEAILASSGNQASGEPPHAIQSDPRLALALHLSTMTTVDAPAADSLPAIVDKDPNATPLAPPPADLPKVQNDRIQDGMDEDTDSAKAVSDLTNAAQMLPPPPVTTAEPHTKTRKPKYSKEQIRAFSIHYHSVAQAAPRVIMTLPPPGYDAWRTAAYVDIEPLENVALLLYREDSESSVASDSPPDSASPSLSDRDASPTTTPGVDTDL